MNSSDEKLKESIKLLKEEIAANEKKMIELKWGIAEMKSRLRKLEKLVNPKDEQQ